METSRILTKFLNTAAYISITSSKIGGNHEFGSGFQVGLEFGFQGRFFNSASGSGKLILSGLRVLQFMHQLFWQGLGRSREDF